MIMQLSMNISVTLAGLLLGAFGQDALGSAATIPTSMSVIAYTCRALIIALHALVF